MALDPQAQLVISSVEAMGGPPFETFSVEEARQYIETIRNFMLPVEEVASVTDTAIPGPEYDIPMRVYRPEGGEELPPAVFYFHGGGFSTGSLDLVDPICRALANRSGCVVMSVDYRLAPEHPYPAAVQDAYIAVSWVGAYGEDFGVDASRIAVVGDSAGANLATVTCMLVRDKGLGEPEIKLQILLCPVADFVRLDTPSHQEFGKGYLLTAGMMDWFKGHYLTGVEDRVAEPYCSPVRMGNLGNLPPAIIVTAEYDPLRDEGEAYGQLLIMNGVMADVRRQDGMIHNFMWFGGVIDHGRKIIDEIVWDLRKTLIG
jgi:acetyl esterase